VKLAVIFTGGSSSKFWTLLANVAALVTILIPVITIATLIWVGTANVPSTILAIYVCLLTTVLLAFLLHQEAKYRHEARYAVAMIPARKAFNCLADLSWNLIEGDGSEQSFLLRLRESLGFVAEAFGLIIDHPCRVSVKMISAEAASTAGQDIRDIQVITLCRDNEEQEKIRATRDRIGNNTDFKKIFVEDALFFFCNDLPAQVKKGYQNSHWDEETFQSEKFDYRSTIVWPIGRSRLLNKQGTLKREIIGFLCVDSLATNAFSETYDVALGAAFSQALHLALHRFRAGNSPSGN
jgi:hypothetical protein